MSPGRSPVDWMESRKENLHVEDEGKLLLRCAERDARRASSGISRDEMRESHVSLETPLSEEIATLGFWLRRHTEPRVSDEVPPRTWRGEGALQRAGAKGKGALQRAGAIDEGRFAESTRH